MMVKIALIDYDGTIHDSDAVLVRSLDGILGFSGEELYRIYVYDVHRALVHKMYLERHDDLMFHCRLIFQHIKRPFDQEAAWLICKKFEEASEIAKKNPIYFPDALPALRRMREAGVRLFLSTGMGAEEKARTFERFAGANYFSGTFSEPSIGSLKTEPEYYRAALKIAGSDPRESVSVGDTPLSDIRHAKLVGMRTIWVNRRREPAPVDVDQIADRQVINLLDAAEFLSRAGEFARG